MNTPLNPIPLTNVAIDDRFWTPRQRLMTDVTIPYMEQILRDEVPGAQKSHAIGNFAMAAGEEQGEYYGMVFQDSDVAKWLEAAAYSLALKPDAALEKRVDDVVALMQKAQQKNGYLNTYFTMREPGHHWHNLLECHELYCAGHLLEAAVALHEAAGKDELLSVATALADHIVAHFSAREGIPGHQEIEIGLMRLYRATGKAAYRDMALTFLNRRGEDPDWFAKHTPKHPDVHYGDYDLDPRDTVYNQSDVPVRQQAEARGHAVRQLYMLVAMADAAAATNDTSLAQACTRVLDDILQKKMYLTGAVGSTAYHESFTKPYDLPPDQGYGETCASVAMAMLAQRMLLLTGESRYADLLERELYNGVLAGMQLDGQRFFYVNPLEAIPGVSGTLSGYRHVLPERPQWYACACCPPNLARLLTSLGGYVWSEGPSGPVCQLYVGGTAKTAFGTFRLETDMPWRGTATCTAISPISQVFTLSLRLPHYAADVRVTLNGEALEGMAANGYLRVTRQWKPGDKLCLSFVLELRRLYANPLARHYAGRVALMRGPLVYCFEAADNGPDLSRLRLPREADIRALSFDPALLGGIVPLEMDGLALTMPDRLYSETPPQASPVTLRAIPYYAWCNRGKGGMTVWIPE